MANAQQVILKVMEEVQGLAKRDKNTQQGFNFRGIDAVMNAVGPALRKHGGFIVPFVHEKESVAVPSKNGGTLNVVRLNVSYEVHGSEGEPIIGVVAAEAFDSGDKATAKAMSVAYRTFLLQLLCLPTDEPDPDTYSYEIGKQTASKRNWIEEVSKLTDIDAVRLLWAEAKAAGVSATDLEWIKGHGTRLSNHDEPLQGDEGSSLPSPKPRATKRG